MRDRIPGREAARSFGMWHAHRFLVLRRVSQLFFLAIFLVGPLTGVWVVKGNMASSLTFDTIPLTDPLMLLASIAAGHLPELTAITGALLVVIAYLFFGGRTYCSWVCPINAVTDAAHWLHLRLGLSKGWQPGLQCTPPRPSGPRAHRLGGDRHALLGNGQPGIPRPARHLVFGLWGAVWVVLAIFLFELLVSEPKGLVRPALSRGRLLRPDQPASRWSRSAAARSRGLRRLHGLLCRLPGTAGDPARAQGHRESQGVISDWACTHCARCIDVCPERVFEIGLRPSLSAASASTLRPRRHMT